MHALHEGQTFGEEVGVAGEGPQRPRLGQHLAHLLLDAVPVGPLQRPPRAADYLETIASLLSFGHPTRGQLFSGRSHDTRLPLRNDAF